MSDHLLDLNAERIDGKVTLASGETVDFSITPEYGYQQWGADQDTLWSTVPLMDGLVEAFNDVWSADHQDLTS